MVSSSSSKAFPGFDALHLLGEKGNSRAFRAQMDVSIDDAFALTRGEKLPRMVHVNWAMGATAPADVVRTTLATPFIVSDRFVGVLERSRFSGWTTYPVDLFGADGQRITGYRGLAVTGRCASIDNARSLPFRKIMPGGVFTWWRGLYFDADSWDGSDLFMPSDNVGWIFCVDAVRRALVTDKITNVTFTRLDEVERMMI